MSDSYKLNSVLNGIIDKNSTKKRQIVPIIQNSHEILQGKSQTFLIVHIYMNLGVNKAFI